VRFTENKVVQSEVKTLMEQYNPVIIPRNKFVEEALYEAVTLKDYTKYHQLLHVLKSPYTLTSEHKPYLEGYDLSDKNYKTYCGT
jgi:uncharacterized protein YdiU (UPF0061 family)